MYPNRTILTRKTTSRSDNRIVNKHATMSASGWSSYASHLALMRPRFPKLSPKHKQPLKKTFGNRAHYNNRPSNAISFKLSAIASTSGRLHCEFVCLLFLQAHRETDRFFASSGGTFQWILPLPPRDVLLTAQDQSGQHLRQGFSGEKTDYQKSPQRMFFLFVDLSSGTI